MKRLRPQCAHCIYWVTELGADPATVGHCHRYPPGIHTNAHTGTVIQKFPTTERHHWCGEWNGDKAWLEDAVHRSAELVAAG